ncbi:hypothetical protein GCM10018953_44620 [Streptosporangium nondiastaticum]
MRESDAHAVPGPHNETSRTSSVLLTTVRIAARSDTKLDRIEQVLERFPDPVFAFDEFRPLGIRPTAGSCWAKQGKPNRLSATYRRTRGSSPWPTPTAAATLREPRHCTATCAGATPTPATSTHSPPNARNAPAPAAKRAFAGADAPSTPRPDQPRTAAPERRRGRFRRRTATEG